MKETAVTGRVVPLEQDPHQAVQALLPWYLNGTLEDAERARVQQHLAGCPECAAALDIERHLVGALDVPASVPDASRGWQRLRQSLQPRLPAKASPLDKLLAGWKGSAPWLKGLAVAQAAVLAVALGAFEFSARNASEPAYHALADAPAQASPNLIVRFRPGASEQDLRQALHDSGAQLVGGPTSSEAFLLSVPRAREAEALKRLKASPSVLLAESLAAPGGGR